jgi:hypothetical protein
MAEPHRLPAFRATHELAVALHAALARAAVDPCGLGGRMRRSAIAAAAAIVRASPLPPERRRDLLARARGRLFELGYALDLAERFGTLDLVTAVELLELQTRACLALAMMLGEIDDG